MRQHIRIFHQLKCTIKTNQQVSQVQATLWTVDIDFERPM